MAKWCQWLVNEFGEKALYCPQPVVKGGKYCKEHGKKVPIWPANETGGDSAHTEEQHAG